MPLRLKLRHTLARAPACSCFPNAPLVTPYTGKDESAAKCRQCRPWRLTLLAHRVIIVGVIRGFRDSDTERLFRRERLGKFALSLQRAALRKLLILDAAETINDLRVPPGSRLEKLAGDRVGQYSIRINDRWRICFRWEEGHAHDVEIVDYH
jgi:toxin HigB-1